MPSSTTPARRRPRWRPRRSCLQAAAGECRGGAGASPGEQMCGHNDRPRERHLPCPCPWRCPCPCPASPANVVSSISRSLSNKTSSRMHLSGVTMIMHRTVTRRPTCAGRGPSVALATSVAKSASSPTVGSHRSMYLAPSRGSPTPSTLAIISSRVSASTSSSYASFTASAASLYVSAGAIGWWVGRWRRKRQQRQRARARARDSKPSGGRTLSLAAVAPTTTTAPRCHRLRRTRLP